MQFRRLIHSLNKSRRALSKNLKKNTVFILPPPYPKNSQRMLTLDAYKLSRHIIYLLALHKPSIQEWVRVMALQNAPRHA